MTGPIRAREVNKYLHVPIGVIVDKVIAERVSNVILKRVSNVILKRVSNVILKRVS